MKKRKNGQIKLSFGMIFSIILIIIFLAFAFYAIKTFLKIQDNAQAGKFISDLKSDIDRVWKSTESSEEKEYSLPSRINFVCFVDFETSASGSMGNIYSELRFADFGNENMVFYPVGSLNIDSVGMMNIALEEITSSENPFCIENVKGKVKLTLVKEINEALVTITR